MSACRAAPCAGTDGTERGHCCTCPQCDGIGCWGAQGGRTTQNGQGRVSSLGNSICNATVTDRELG